MAHTACLVCLISIVSGRCKKGENALEDVTLVAGTQQNLSNLYSLDIYGLVSLPCFVVLVLLMGHSKNSGSLSGHILCPGLPATSANLPCFGIVVSACY